MSAFLFILTLDDVLISIKIIGSQHGFSVKDLDSVVADKEWVPLGLKFLFILTLDDVLISLKIIGSQHGFSVKDLDSVVADKEWVPLGLKFFPFQHQLLLTSWQTNSGPQGLPSFLFVLNSYTSFYFSISVCQATN